MVGPQTSWHREPTALAAARQGGEGELATLEMELARGKLRQLGVVECLRLRATLAEVHGPL